MAIYDWALDQNAIQDAIYGIGSKFADLENISSLEGEYGIGSTGAASDARHQSYFSSLSDTFAGKARAEALGLGTPNKLNQFIGDAGAFGAGLIVEIPGAYRALTGTAPWKDVWEDIKANWEGTFGTAYGTTSEDIYKNVYGRTGKKLLDQRATQQGLAQVAMQKQIQQAQDAGGTGGAQPTLQAQVTAQANREARERVGRGEARDYGHTQTRSSSGWRSDPMWKGGIVDLYRYGGFI